MSVRSRIAQFEALSREEDKDDGSKERSNEAATTEKRKRFLYPGSSNRPQEQEQPAIAGVGGPTKSRSTGLLDFEADLQEVWSVRKNIHHTGNGLKSMTASPKMSVTAGKYSRHGTFAAQKSQGPVILSGKEAANRGVAAMAQRRDDFSFETGRSPLQEQNAPWNVRSATFSYSHENAKRPIESPQDLPSPPTAKRKTTVGSSDIIRSTLDQRVSPTKAVLGQKERLPEKVSYAKRMAQGYLRSMGMGEFTPTSSNYTQDREEASPERAVDRRSVSKWRKSEAKVDEFEFDV